MHKYHVISQTLFRVIVSGLVLGLSFITARGEQNNTELTFINFKKTVHSEFIRVNTHVLVMEGSSYCDDAFDKEGHYYYFYMVDFTKGLKAYITNRVLEPHDQSMKNTLEVKKLNDFIHDIKKNIEKDGGIEKIIKVLDKKENILQISDTRKDY